MRQGKDVVHANRSEEERGAVSFDALSGEGQKKRPCTFGLAFGSKGLLDPFKPTYFLAPGGRLKALSARSS